MRIVLAKVFLAVSTIVFAASVALLTQKQEPFYSYFFLFAWGSYILFLDSWLYLKGGESLFLEHPVSFLTFLIPCSAFIWFMFELVNLRIANWHYIGVPSTLPIRWAGYFFSFATVLPGIFLTANLLDHYGVFRKNEFSQFFSEPFEGTIKWGSIAGGAAMLLLPLLFPLYFFPLVWGFAVLLFDPIVADWQGKSLLQEWRAKNWNRTLQILLAGAICGILWESWNFWAGAKWVYTVPLPDALLKNLKIFEMPVLGFLGFPPFALECFVLYEFFKTAREKTPPPLWKLFLLISAGLMLFACYMIDAKTVRSFR